MFEPVVVFVGALLLLNKSCWCIPFWERDWFISFNYLCSHFVRVMVRKCAHYFYIYIYIYACFLAGENHQRNLTSCSCHWIITCQELMRVHFSGAAGIPQASTRCICWKMWTVEVPSSWGQMHFVDGQMKCWRTNIPSIGWWEISRKAPYIQGWIITTSLRPHWKSCFIWEIIPKWP